MSELAAVSPSRPAHHPLLAYRHSHHSDPEAAALAIAREEEEYKKERAKEKARRGQFYVAGRMLLSALFVVSAVSKAVSFDVTREAMEGMNIAIPSFLLSCAIGIELLGGAAIALGYKARVAAVALIGYLCTVTLFIHGNLSLEANRASALANLAFCGGLLLLAAHGAGSFSLDKVMARRKAELARN